MRITILTIGSRGDVEPYLALGSGLQAAAHRVRLATHERFAGMVADLGLEFHPVAGDPLETLEGEAGRRWLEAGKNPVAFMKRMRDAAKPLVVPLLNDYWDACQDTDLILFPVLAAFPGVSIGEKLGVPVLRAYLQPLHRTASFPSTSAPPRPSLGRAYIRLSYPLAEQLFWQLLRPQVNRWREETLGLPPYSLRGPAGAWRKSRDLCLYGFSPSVVPKAPEWGDEVRITGYWFLDTPEAWEPPAALVDFLESGPPPVFVGFGSMTGRHMEEVTRLVLDALARSGQRGLLLSGWGGLGGEDLPERVHVIDSAPFAWLFPRMAAVVHHGGAGTTGAGLRAGVPNVVVPFFGDQFFWGWRVEILGAGPQPIPFKSLSVERLASAVREAVTYREMRRRAADLGQRIRAEDGVANAVRVIAESSASVLSAP